MALLGGLLSFIGVVISFLILPSALGEEFKNSPLADYSISPLTSLIMLMVVILTYIIFAAIEVAIASYARSFKEAQTYLTPITFLVLIPAYFTMYKTPNDLTESYFVIPLINSLAIFKELIYGVVNAQHILSFVLSSVIYLIISIMFASKMFENEKVLFRG